MAITRKCDRCGKVYEHYGLPNNSEDNKKFTGNGISLIYWLFGNSSYKNVIGYDLCPDCLKQLKIWLSKPDTTIVSFAKSHKDYADKIKLNDQISFDDYNRMIMGIFKKDENKDLPIKPIKKEEYLPKKDDKK